MSTSIPTDLAGGPGAPEIYQPGDLSEVLKKLVGGNDFSGVLAIDDREKASDFIALAQLLVSLQNGPDDLGRIVALLRNHDDLELVATVFKNTLEVVLSGSHLPKVDVNFADVAAQGVDALSAQITTVGTATLVVQKFVIDVPGLNILLNKVNLLLKWFEYLPQYEIYEQAQVGAKKDVAALAKGEAQQAIAVVGAQLAVSADPGETILPVAVAAGALAPDLVAHGLPFVKAHPVVTSNGDQSGFYPLDNRELLAPPALSYSGGTATDTLSGQLTVGQRKVLEPPVIPFVSASVVEQYNLYIAFCERWRAVFDKAVANDQETIKDVFVLLADIHQQSFNDVLDKLGKISSDYFQTDIVNYSTAELTSLRAKCTAVLDSGIFGKNNHQTIEECSRALDVMLSDLKSHSEAISKGAVDGKIVSYHPYTEFLRTKVIPTAQAQLEDLDRTESVKFARAPGGFPPQLRARIVAQLQPLPPRES